MLDRILNINPQDKYKSGIKVPSVNPYVVNRYDEEKQNRKDSVLFSPLAKLLSKINWKILNIEYPTNDEILFNFLVNDLEFITLIDFNEIYSEQYQQFTIYRTIESFGKNVQYEVKLKVEKGDIGIINKADPITTEGISTIFDRIKQASPSYGKISQPIILKEFVNGIQNEVYEELNYILKVIFTFISTRNTNRIKSQINLKSQKNIPIIMQKVVINNTEKIGT
jgi:hypothetical protein